MATPVLGSKTLISQAAIRSYALQIAERFQPDQIILFGSYLSGAPNDDSDVDLVVIAQARNQMDHAVKIRCELTAPFALDLLVRKPKDWQRQISEGDSFATEILATGKSFMKRATRQWVRNAEEEK